MIQRMLALLPSFRFRLLLTGLLCLTVFPVEAKERQYKVEAAYLYNFFNYITWPGYDSPQALKDVTICVYGRDPIVSYLRYIKQKMAKERALKIRTIGTKDSAENCHLLFMRHQVSWQVLATMSRSTLTVFKPDDPLDRGGMVELTNDEERITIRIDKPELQAKGFQISSRLLELARVR